MGNHSAVRRRPPDLRQVLVGVLALLLVVGTGVVLALLLTRGDVPPPRVERPAPRTTTTTAAVPVVVTDEERASALAFAETAATEIVSTRSEDLADEVAAATDLMTPRYARSYRRAAADVGGDDSAEGTVVEARVVGTGLMGIDRDTADVLVFVDQASTQGAAKPVTSATRFVLTLSRSRSQWRVDGLTPFTEAAEHVAEPDRVRDAVLTVAGEAARTRGKEPAEVLAAGLARYDASSATVLVATSADAGTERLRVAMALADGAWSVSDVEVVSAG